MIRPRWLTQIAATWDKSHAAIAAGTKSRPYVGFLFRCYSDPYKAMKADKTQTPAREEPAPQQQRTGPDIELD